MRVLQGHTDLDITELGNRQLEALEKRFSGIKLDKVYSSPLIRAQKTARAIIGGRDIPLELCRDLTEINCGIYDGEEYDKIFRTDPEFKDIWYHRLQDFCPERGEKISDSYRRIWNAVKSIAVADKGKTVACVSHGAVIRCLFCRLFHGNLEYINNVDYCENTAVSLIRFDDGMNPRVIFFNDSSHLTEELKNKGAAVPLGDK